MKENSGRNCINNISVCISGISSLIDELTVYENIETPLCIRMLSPANAKHW